jgi:cytoskeletal protein CcmA (bactofilin family)
MLRRLQCDEDHIVRGLVWRKTRTAKAPIRGPGGDMAFGKRAKHEGIEQISSGTDKTTSRAETFIDERCVLAGELCFGENVRIDGRVEGQIRAEKAVIVGEGAEIDATIDADVLEVYGRVVGDIRVTRGTTLHKTARVEGEIQTAGIVVEEGARFKGCIVIGPNDEPSESPKPPSNQPIAEGSVPQPPSAPKNSVA